MCDAATQAVLESIVQSWVGEQKMFTALNVSRDAQRNHGVTLRHNDMKNEIHRIYANNDMNYDNNGTQESYQRKLIDIPGISNAQVWAYYPQGVDPDNYDLSQLVQGPIDCKDAGSSPNSVSVPALATSGQTTAVATPVVKSVSSPSQTSSTTGGYAVDKRKRLWIPRELLRSVGLKSGSDADVHVDNKTIVVTPKGLRSGTAATTYKVDSKNNIAISRVIFSDAGLDSDSYDILNVNGSIVVKKP